METMQVSAGKAKIPVALHRRDSDAAPASLVVICNPLPLAGEASHHLIESIVDALVEQSIAVATYEPACEGLILEDFDKYSTADSVAEINAVLTHFAQFDKNKQPLSSHVVLLAYGIGAITAAMVAANISMTSLCLLNPLTPADIATWRGQTPPDGIDAKSMPAEFAGTVGSLDPLAAMAKFTGATLVLSGPADRVAKAESAEQFIAAARAAGHKAMHLLIACGDHVLSDPLARQSAIEHITHFSNPRG